MNQPPKILDMSPEAWREVSRILQTIVPQYTVWAFGSRVTGKAKPYSDLDLAIITTQPLSLDVYASLTDAFEESELPWRVDIVDWATTSESFRRLIEKNKIVIQSPLP